MTARALRRQLLALAARDRETRARLAADGSLFAGYHAEMQAVHVANAQALQEVLATVTWPGRSLVGEDGAEAAFTIAQHAISLPRFQLLCRERLAAAVLAGEAPEWHLACLIDRIRFNERRAQVYGTVLDWDAAGELSPWPIENPDEVDRRRAGCLLPPLKQAVAAARKRARRAGERPPADFAARERAIRDWARSVGWLDIDDPR